MQRLTWLTQAIRLLVNVEC